MKHLFLAAIAATGLILLPQGASAQSNDVILKRLEAVEKELEAIKKENAALRDRARQRVARTEPEGRPVSGSGALAAAEPVYKAAPLPPQPLNWTGFYIGAHIGSAWGTKQQEISYISSNYLSRSSHTVNGWLAGGQVGYNYQVDRWVWGVEAQFSWANVDGFGLCNIAGEFNCRTNVNWLGTLAGRFGFTIDHALVYVKGGGAWVHDKYESILLSQQPETFGSASETRSGWMWGTGVEYAVTRNWSAKIEYDYLDFGTRDVVYSNSTNAGILGAVPTKERIHLIKAGLNYKFDWGKWPVAGKGPVVSKF